MTGGGGVRPGYGLVSESCVTLSTGVRFAGYGLLRICTVSGGGGGVWCTFVYSTVVCTFVYFCVQYGCVLSCTLYCLDTGSDCVRLYSRLGPGVRPQSSQIILPPTVPLV